MDFPKTFATQFVSVWKVPARVVELKEPKTDLLYIYVLPYPQFYEWYTHTSSVNSLTDRAVASANLVAI